jgi:hypothetical protein
MPCIRTPQRNPDPGTCGWESSFVSPQATTQQSNARDCGAIYYSRVFFSGYEHNLRRVTYKVNSYMAVFEKLMQLYGWAHGRRGICVDGGAESGGRNAERRLLERTTHNNGGMHALRPPLPALRSPRRHLESTTHNASEMHALRPLLSAFRATLSARPLPSATLQNSPASFEDGGVCNEREGAYSCVSVALRKSRFINAMPATLMPLGHTASHSY